MTSHPYNPIVPGSAATYQIYAVDCGWDASTLNLWVLNRTYSHTQKTSYSLHNLPSFWGYLPLYVGYQHATDSPAEPINWMSTLTDGVAYAGGEYYIGEAVNNAGIVHLPFIAKLAYNPFPGQTIDQVSKVYDKQTKAFVADFHWMYKTIAHRPVWGAFTDCWHTGLVEYNQAGPAAIYNYIHMRDVGLVDLWYGVFQPDGSIRGHEYYRVG
jgi:hypothetical protein